MTPHYEELAPEERWLGPRGETMIGANLTSARGRVGGKPASVEWRFAKGTAADCPPAP